MTTQNSRILSYLKSGRKLTALKALKLFGCLRMASRAFELRAQGYAIKGEMITIGKKHVMKYSL